MNFPKTMWAFLGGAVGLLLTIAQGTSAESTMLKPGARVAIIGDSITEQKLYSKYAEAYLLACSGVNDIHVFQYGWGGETANGFSQRLANDLRSFHPTVATLCYGMNDGGYQPYRAEIGANYERSMNDVVEKLVANGVTSIVVGSPGAVDFDFFRPGQKMGEVSAQEAYNDNLAHLRDIDRQLAEKHHQAFADVHGAMIETMKRAKAALGSKYDVCGKDGFHPGPNGQLIMAYAFLKGLGLDGDIGTIVVDMGGEASGRGAHQVRGSKGSAEITSTRWPFCYAGDAADSNATRSIAPYLPFNQDLNRFTLQVKGLTSAKAKVQWGDEAKEFSREALEQGINLMQEFGKTPFDAPFAQLVDAVGNKQAFETYMIKQVITNFRSYPQELQADAELQRALDVVRNRFQSRQESLDAEVRQVIKPIQHTLRVMPL